jgi:rhodanese-related sulfurtransferase
VIRSFPARAAALAAGLLAAVACSGRAAGEPFAMASMDEVQAMLGKPDVAVVDANPPDVFEKNHLPGARLYKSAALTQLLPADKDARLVFYCASPS